MVTQAQNDKSCVFSLICSSQLQIFCSVCSAWSTSESQETRVLTLVAGVHEGKG